MKQRLPWPGEAHAWQRLAQRSPEALRVQAGATVAEDASEIALVCFGQTVRVMPAERRIASPTPVGTVLLESLSEFSRLAVLLYLCQAENTTPSGRLVKPSEVKGGEIFVQGTHVLPLDDLARRFGGDRAGFLARGRELGGEALGFGDMSLQLAPFPRLPMVLIVWAGDDEFPARAALLLDSGQTAPFAADMIWATANIALALMLR